MLEIIQDKEFGRNKCYIDMDTALRLYNTDRYVSMDTALLLYNTDSYVSMDTALRL